MIRAEISQNPKSSQVKTVPRGTGLLMIGQSLSVKGPSAMLTCGKIRRGVFLALMIDPA